jgi:ketosteroid isomerase-like protein
VKQALCMALILAGATVSWAATCPTNQAKNEATLLQAEHRWAAALERHDAETVGCLVADEFEDADVDGSLHNRVQALARIPHRRLSRNQLEDLHAHLFGDFAYVRGLNRFMDTTGKPLAQVCFTDILVYREGRWQAVAGQETLLRKDGE